ncbi:MAG: hypothetical protein JWO67_2381 [Streptosporangiaceae bacterium]|nr:hypothetical protein [Streptosporangiaceae bacterium]
MSHPTPESDAPRVAAEHLYLLVAIVTATVAVAIWIVDAANPGSSVPRAVYDVLCLAAALAGCGYLVRSAESHVIHRVERAYMEGYADGFTDGAASPSPSPRPLRSIH